MITTNYEYVCIYYELLPARGFVRVHEKCMRKKKSDAGALQFNWLTHLRGEGKYEMSHVSVQCT